MKQTWSLSEFTWCPKLPDFTLPIVATNNKQTLSHLFFSLCWCTEESKLVSHHKAEQLCVLTTAESREKIWVGCVHAVMRLCSLCLFPAML